MIARTLLLCLSVLFAPASAAQGAASAAERAVGFFYRSGYLYSAALVLGSHLKRGRPLRPRLEGILRDIVSKTGIAPFGSLGAEEARRYGPTSPTVNFIFGIRAFQAQDFPSSLSFLRRIPRSHPLGVEVQFALAAANALVGDHDRAGRYYEACRDDALEREAEAIGANGKRYFALMAEHCTIHRARGLYERGRYREALDIYEGIAKTSYLWPYVLIEKAWSNYQLADYNRALGLLATYNAPLMSSYILPEADVLRSLSYYRLCLWDDTAKVADAYKGRLDQSEKLGRILDSYKGTDFIEEAVRSARAAGGQDPFVRALMIQMRKKVRFSQEVSGYLRLAGEIRKLAKVGKNPLAMRLMRSLKSLSRRRLEQINAYIRLHMYRFLNDINRFSVEMAKIGIEMAARRRKDLYAGKKEERKDSSGGILRGGLENVRAADNEQLYTFDGEFWADELGEYSFALKSRCSASGEVGT